MDSMWLSLDHFSPRTFSPPAFPFWVAILLEFFEGVLTLEAQKKDLDPGEKFQVGDVAYMHLPRDSEALNSLALPPMSVFYELPTTTKNLFPFFLFLAGSPLVLAECAHSPCPAVTLPSFSSFHHLRNSENGLECQTIYFEMVLSDGSGSIMLTKSMKTIFLLYCLSIPPPLLKKKI